MYILSCAPVARSREPRPCCYIVTMWTWSHICIWLCLCLSSCHISSVSGTGIWGSSIISIGVPQPTYHSISIAVPRYIAMQLPSYITWLVVIHHLYIALHDSITADVWFTHVTIDHCTSCYTGSSIQFYTSCYEVMSYLYQKCVVILECLPLPEKSHGGHWKVK